MHSSIKNRLLACTALIAVSALAPQMASPARAAGNGPSAVGNIPDLAIITLTDADGLDFDPAIGGNASRTVTIDPTGSISFGAAGGSDAITVENGFNPNPIIINVDNSVGAGETVTFAGDIESNDTTLTINIVDVSVVLTGDAALANPSAAIDINLGKADASATTASLTVDTVIAESLDIAATIGALEAGDTTTLNVTNSDGTATNKITFTKAIGGGAAATTLDALNIGSAASGGNAVFNSTVRATTITVFTDNASDAVADFNGAVTATDLFVTGGDTAGDNASASFGATSTFTTITLDDGTASATVSLDGGVDITGNFVAAGAGEGTLTLLGAHTITGDVGVVGGNELKLLTINAGAVATTGDIAATSINFAADGSLSIATGKTIEGAITSTTAGQGTLTLAGAATITGDVGVVGGNELKLLTINAGAVATTGDIAATTINFAGAGTLTIADNKNVEGAITTSANDQGTLTLSGTSTITGNIGSTTALDLLAINAGATGEIATFSGNVFAKTLNVTGDGTVALGGDFTGATLFAAATNGTLTTTAGKTVTGAITGTTGAQTLNNNAALTGAVDLGDGANVINQIAGSITGNVTTTAGADTLSLTGGAITGAVNLGSGANILNLTAGTITGSITTGADADTLNHTVAGVAAVTGGIDLGAGANIINITANGLTADLVTAGGGDTLNLTGGGLFTGDANLGAGANVLNLNDGTIDGSITTGADADTLNHTGAGTATVTGLVSLGNGANVISVSGGLLDADITTGIDNDSLTLTSTGSLTGIIDLGGGDNSVSLLGTFTGTMFATGGTITYNFTAGDDVSTLTSASLTGNFNMLAGDDTLDMTDSKIYGNVDMGDGSDTVLLDPSVIFGNLILGGGDNSVTLDHSRVTGNVTALGGNDKLKMTSSTGGDPESVIGGDVDLGGGDNLIDMTDSRIDGNLTTGGGKDKLVMADKAAGSKDAFGDDVVGSLIGGDVDLGGGDNSISLTDSRIGGGLTTSADSLNDTLTMLVTAAGRESVIGGDVDLGGGDNTIDMKESRIDGSLTTGGGKDSLTMSDGASLLAGVTGGLIGGDVDLGAGVNSISLTDSKILGAVAGGGTETLALVGASSIGGNVGSAPAKVETITAGTDAKTATFGGDVFTTTLTSIGDGFIALDGNFTGNVNFAATFDATVTLADGKNFTGKLTNATTNEGTLTLSGTSTVSGAVGSTGAGLKAVNAGADAGLATFDGLVKTTLLTVSGTGTVALNAGLAGAANFAAASTTGAITLADNFDITGAVDSSAASQGILNVLGTSTIGGAVGATNALRAVNAGATGEVATFSAAVKATTLTVTGTGEVVLDGGLTGAAKFGGDGLITLADGKDITGAVTTTVNNTGTLSFLGDSTVTGNVGTAALRLKGIDAGVTGKTVTFGGAVFVAGSTLHVTGGGTVTLSGGLTGDANFDADGVLKLGAAKILDGDVTTSFGGLGTLEFLGAGTITGDIGVIGGNELKLVTINAGAVAAGGHIAAATINFAGAGSLTIADNKNIEGAITTSADDQGTLILAGTSTVTGNIGASTALDLLEIKAGANGEAATFDGNVFTKTLTVSGTGAVSINGALTATTASFAGNGSLTLGEGAAISGAVTTAANNTGTLTFLGGGSVTGAVGAAGKALNDVKAGADGATVTFGGDVFVATSTLHITGSGTVALSGSLTGNANFDADGVLTLADTKTITGNVTTSNAGLGTLTLLGGHTITGNVGALGAGNELRLVSINGAVIATGNIAATDITFTGASSLSIAAGKTVEGALTGDASAQTLTNLGTIDGDINLGAGANVVTLTGGAISGNLATLGGIDTLTMTGGSITGDVDLGNGANIFDLDAGGNSITGNLTGGSDIDTLSMLTSAITGDVDLGGGANIFDLSIGAGGNTITGNVTAGSGIDTLTMLASAITGDINLGAGANVVTLTGGAISGNLTTLGDIDTLTMTGGSITGNVNLGNGANIFDLDAGGNSITGNLTAGIGIDTLNMLTSIITGDVDLGDGANIFDLSIGAGGNKITGNLTAGSGIDTLKMLASIITGDVDLGDGANIFDLSIGAGGNSITGNITAGSGDDTLDMYTSIITGNVDLGEGANYIKVTDSTITGDIIVGGGDDIVKIDPSLVDGSVYLGNGFNQLDLLASTITGNVTGGTGIDDVYLDNSSIGGNVSLDGGDDILTLKNGSLIVGSVDLGAGDDTLSVDATSKIEGAIILGTGVNDLTITGQTLNANVTSGIDDDTLTLDTATLNGDVDLDGGSDTLTMTDSEIFGDVDMGDGSDFVYMDPSTIFGDLALGGGHNYVKMEDSIVTGDVTAGSGNDYLKMFVTLDPYSVIFGLADLGGGDNIINMTSSRIDGGLTTGAGWDTLVMTDGSAIGVGVDLGDGNNTLTITGSEIFGAVTLGGGSDTVLLDPSVIFGDLILGGGDNILTLENSRVTGDVTAAGGDDKVYMTYVAGPYSRIGGNLVLGDGFNLVDMDYAYIGGSLTAGSGNDDLYMFESAITGDVDLGGGNNYAELVFSGIAGNLTAGSGYDDLFMLDSAISGDVDLGGGSNYADLIFSDIAGNLTGGSGYDNLDMDDSSITGNVDLGAGTNIITLTDSKILGAVAGGGDDTLDLVDDSSIGGNVGSALARVEAVSGGSAGTTATFDGDVFADLLTVIGAGTVALGGDLTGAANFAADGVITLGDGGAITGAITTAVNNTGTLTLPGNGTVTGPVGDVGFSLLAVNGGGNGTTATFNGDIIATTLNVTGAGEVVINDSLTGTANFGGAGTLTLGDGATITGAVTTALDDKGTLVFLGSGGVTGDVGTGALSLNDIEAGATGAIVTFGGDVFVATSTLHVTGDGTVALIGSLTGAANFDANGEIELAGGESITGNLTASNAGQGALTLLGAATITGEIGVIGAGNQLGLVAINGGAVTTTGNIAATSINFAAGGSLSLAAGKVLEGGVTTAIANTGTLTLAGAATIIGDIGVAGGNELTLVTISAAAVTTSGDIAATAINFAADGSLTLADGSDVDGAITNTTTNQGTLTLLGTSTVSGATGSTGVGLKAVNAGAAGAVATFDGLVKTTTLTVTGLGGVVLNAGLVGAAAFAGNGELTLGDGGTITGAVTTAVNNTGTLTFLGSGGVTGAVGAAGMALDDINAGATGATVTFGGDVFVATSTLHITGDGTVSIAGDLTGNANFDADGVLSMASAADITGNVTASNAGQGTLSLLGAHTITGNVGALGAGNELRLVSINGAVTATGNIAATDITFTGVSSLSIATGKTVEGALAGDGAIQTLTNLGTIDGDIDLGAGANVVTLTGGAITGNLATLGGDDTLLMDASAITGNVALGNGANIFDLDAGGNTITGNVTGGSGIDTLLMDASAITGDVDLGDGANLIDLAYSSITGNITGGIGYDGLYMDASAITGDVDLGDGANTFDLATFGGNSITGNVTAGIGDDGLYMDASAITGNVDLGEGANFIGLTDSSITGDIIVGGGDDILIIDPSLVDGDVYLGDGDNLLDLLDSTITGNVTGGTGVDTVSLDNSSIGGNVSLDGGNDILTLILGSSIGGDVSLGDGDNMLSVDATSSIGGAIDLGGGANTLTLTGQTLNGPVTGGSGDDTLTLDTTTINGAVNLGDGSNIIDMTDSSIFGDVTTGNGHDTLLMDPSYIIGNVNLGDGNNIIDMLDSGISGGLTTGTGDDALDMDNSHIGLNVNLGSGANVIKLVGASAIDGDLTTGIGNDTLTLDGVSIIGGAIDLGDGQNLLTLTNGTTGAITTGDDSDTLNLTVGSTGAIDTGAGNDTINAMDVTINGDVGTALNAVETINAGIGASTTTFNGKVFGSTMTLNVGAGTVNLNGDVAGNIVFTEAGGDLILGLGDVNQGVIVGGTITTDAGGQGTLTLLGNGTVTGNVGNGTGADLLVVNAGATDTLATFGGSVFAETLNVTGDGTVALGGDFTGDAVFLGDGEIILANLADINGAITNSADGTGTLTILGTSLVTGDVGTVASELKVVNAGVTGSTVTFGGDVFAQTFNVTGTGNIVFAGDLSGGLHFETDRIVTLADLADIDGAVTTFADAMGTLTFLGSSVVGGDIGEYTKGLKTINVNGDGGDVVTLLGDVFVSGATMNITGDSLVELGGNFTGNAAFVAGGNGEIELADGKSFIGAITTATGNKGNLTLLGDGTVTGNVGAAGLALAAVDAGATGLSSFGGDVFATLLSVTGTGTVEFNGDFTGVIDFTDDGFVELADGGSINGDIISSGFGGDGTLTLVGNGTVNGKIGASGGFDDIDAIFAGANDKTATFNDDVFADTLTVTGDGNVVLNDSFTGDATFDSGSDGVITLAAPAASGEAFTGDITTFASNNGTLDVQGTIIIDGGVGTDAVGTATERLKKIIAGYDGQKVTFIGDLWVTDTSLDIIGDGEVVITGNTTGNVNLLDGGTLTLSDGSGLDGNLITAAQGTGTLNLLGDSDVTGQIGDILLSGLEGNGNALAWISIGDGLVSVAGDIAATTINFTAELGELEVGVGANMEGDITAGIAGYGTLSLLGTNYVDGDIGVIGDDDGLNELLALNIFGPVLTNGHIAARTINLADADSALSVTGGKNVEGDINALIDGDGDLVLLGDHTIDGDIGDLGAGNQLNLVDISGDVVTTGHIAVQTINFTDTQPDEAGSLTVASSKDIEGDITTEVANTGTLILLGYHNITGNIGVIEVPGLPFENELALITINGPVLMDGDIAATTVNFAAAIGALTFTDLSDIEADITTATADTGSLEFLGSSTVTGNIGITGGRELALITIHSGVVTTDGDIAATGINFAADADATGTLSVALGHDVTATITATEAGEGTLEFLGDNKVTGEIGVAGILGNELFLIALNGAVVTTGNISATTINFDSEGELTVADGKNVETTDISTSSAGTGALMLLGDHTVAGDIGSGGALRLITINGDVATTGNIAATTINFASLVAADDDSLTIAAGKDVTAAITTATNDHGTLNFLGSSTVTGNVGASELRLQEINAGVNAATVTFDGDVFVTEATLHVTGDGTVELNGDFFGDANFDNNGTIVLGAAPLEPLGSTDFNGDITTSTDGEGTLDVFDTSTITGTVGTGTSLDLAEILVDGGADDTATFDSDVFAEAINVDADGNAVFNAEVTTEKMTIFADADVTINGGVGLVGDAYVMDGFTGDAHFDGAGGTLTLADDVDFDGDITTENDGEGTLTVAGTAVFTGTIGTDTKALLLINAGVDGETVTFQGAVYAETLTRTGTGTIIFEIGFNGTSIDLVDDSTVVVEDGADIDGDTNTGTDGEGTVVFEGDSTVTGDVGDSGTDVKEVKAGDEAGDEVDFKGEVFTELLTIGGGTVTLQENFEHNANFEQDGTLILANNADPDPNFTGNITTDADNQGTLDVKGTSTITGNIGTSPTFDLKKILAGYDGQTATFIGDIFVSDSTLDIVGSGTVSIDGDTVGGGAFLADGTLTLESGSAWTGNITTANAGLGTLELTGSHFLADEDIVGNIGVIGGNQLGLVSIDDTTKVDGDIASNTINFTTGFGSLSLTDGSDVEGNITTDSDNDGDLILLGSSTITGNVGINDGPDRAIELIMAGASGSTSIFDGIVNAGIIDLSDADATATGTTNFLKEVTAVDFFLDSDPGVGQNATVTGDFTALTANVLAGAGADADATLTLNGAANTFTALATLNDGALGRATLIFSGAMAQTVDGEIVGASAGEGALVIANSAAGGVTFNDQVGVGPALRSITIAKTGADSSATFMDDVSATNIILGDGIDANTNTVTFDSTVNDIDVTGALNGTLGDADNVIVNGGGTVTANSVWGGGVNGVLSQVLVDGAGTILEAMASMTALQFTLANDGTLLTSAPVILTGAIDGTADDGTGNLDIQADTTVNGNIGFTTPLTMVNVGDATLTANGHIAAATVNFEVAGSEIVMADNTNLTGNVTASASSIGTLTLLGDNDAGVDHTITGNIGNLTGGSDGGPDNELALITIEGNVVTTGNIAASFITFDPTSAGSDYTTLTIADGKTIEGDITTTIANTGTLIFLGDGTVNGDVGTDALGLKAIQAYGGLGEVVTINGLVFVSGSTVEILGAGTVILTADTEDAAMFFEDGTLQLNAGVDFTDTGVIATDAANQGTLTLLGHLGGDIMTIAGDIGELGAGNELKLINITGTVETLGNIAATNIDFTGVGSLSIAAGKTLESSLITGDGAAQSLLNSGNINSNIDLGGGANVFNNMGGSTFTGSLNASGSVDMTVGAGAIATITGTSVTGAGGFLTITGGLLTLNANFSHGGVFTNNGVVNMNLNTLTVATHAGGTGLYEIDVLQTAALDPLNINAHSFGKMVVTGGAANFGGVGTSVDVNVMDDTIMAHGTEMLFASGGTAGPATLLTEAVTDNSGLLDFTMISGATSVTTGDDAGDVYLRVFNQLTVLGATPNNNAVAQTLALLGTAGDATLDTIQLLISDLAGADPAPGVQPADAAAVNAALDILLPTVDGAAVTTVMAFTNDSLDVVDHQLAGLRLDGGAGRGISAGNNGQGARFWIEAFGKTATQDPRQNINGYDADTGGIALGLDTRNLGKKTLFGLAFSYASTDADSDNAGRTKTEIDSYQITGYGDIGLGNNNYFSAMAAYAFNSNDTDRRVIIPVAAPAPPVSALATGSYDSDQFAVRAELGHDFKGGMTTFTPAVLVNYASYSADDYTETGAGGASLNVESESLDLFELGLGADISWDIKKPGGGAAMRPNLTAGWRYDFATDPIQLTSSFTGGGMAFTTNGADPAENKFNLGAGVKYFNVDHWELTASYGYDFMSDYDAHSGMVRAGFRF